MSDEILADGFSDAPLWWQDNAPSEHTAPDGLAEADVIIVGSGNAGLSCAHGLARAGQ